MWQVLPGLDNADSILRQQNAKDFTGNNDDIYDILNDKSKSQSKPSKGA